jgi:Tol biopolymer transport system component
MARFFVSYSRSVKDEVQKVVDLLRASGHDVWWDGDIPIMADWWATILDKIEWCEVFIFVTSEKSVESPYCIAELKYANNRQRPILPFMLEDPTQLTLPPQLPTRNQWLMYDGNPANMLGQINTAYHLIEWHKHNDAPIRRPPEPNKGGVSLAKQYQNARQYALDMQFEKARDLLGNIKRLDYGEWGADCDEWLRRIGSYEPLAELVDSDATRDKAQHDWDSHVRQFGNDFDPYQIEQKLKARNITPKLPIVPIIATIIVIGFIVVTIYAFNLFSPRPEGEGQGVRATDTTEVAQIASDNSPNDINADDARATGAAQAYATLTALAPTNTPTITPTPTDTPISSSDIQQTAQAEIFATETYMAQTQAVIAQETQSAVLTEQFIAGATATYIVQLSLTPLPTDTPIPTQIPSNTPRPTSTPAPTSNVGQIVFNERSVGPANIYRINTDGTNLQQLTNTTSYADYAPSWSSDGNQIGFYSDRSGNWEVYVMDTEGNNIQQITDTSANGFTSSHPSWSPDGSQIAFTGVLNYSSMSYNEEIYIMDADGTNVHRITNQANGDFGASWSPLGDLIAFTSTIPFPKQYLYLVDPVGGYVRKVTPFYGGQASWSPDGSLIAFAGTTFNSGRNDIYILDIEKSAITLLVDNAHSPTWSPDGCFMAYVQDDDIYIWDILADNSQRITSGTSPDWNPQHNSLSDSCMPQVKELFTVEYGCSLSSTGDVNLRSGPGTIYSAEGTLDSGQSMYVSGQMIGEDGYRWWRLQNYAWVRSDLVNELGDCEDVFTVNP